MYLSFVKRVTQHYLRLSASRELQGVGCEASDEKSRQQNAEGSLRMLDKRVPAGCRQTVHSLELSEECLVQRLVS